jgi:hypothetical protein
MQTQSKRAPLPDIVPVPDNVDKKVVRGPVQVQNISSTTGSSVCVETNIAEELLLTFTYL